MAVQTQEIYKDSRLIPGKKRRLVIWLVSLVVFYLFSYLVDPLNSEWKEYYDLAWYWIAYDLFTSLIICALIAEVSLWIDTRLDKSLSWKDNPRKRLLIQAFSQIFGSIIIILTIYWFLDYLFFDDSEYSSPTAEITMYAQGIVISIVVSIMISAFNTVEYLLYNWTRTAMEATEHKLRATEHKQAAMAAELQALKLQIDPHFIFNNLSVLSELILENQQLGYEYAENFAKVYRYLLMNARRDVIQLEEELKFLDSYIFLIQKRIGEGVHFDISVHRNDLVRQIPPLTLQLLVENAIKHNKTVKGNPLSIEINSAGDGNLLISNTLIPMTNKVVSSGIGWDNIISRYKLLSDQRPEIVKTPDLFIVQIPLLP